MTYKTSEEAIILILMIKARLRELDPDKWTDDEICLALQRAERQQSLSKPMKEIISEVRNIFLDSFDKGFYTRRISRRLFTAQNQVSKTINLLDITLDDLVLIKSTQELRDDLFDSIEHLHTALATLIILEGELKSNG